VKLVRDCSPAPAWESPWAFVHCCVQGEHAEGLSPLRSVAAACFRCERRGEHQAGVLPAEVFLGCSYARFHLTVRGGTRTVFGLGLFFFQKFARFFDLCDAYKIETLSSH